MKIEQLKIRNFKSLHDIVMRNIPNFCVIVGANGSGKSALFNVFAFLQEALRSNVHFALVEQGGSRGFAEVRSRNAEEDANIEIELKFRERKKNPLITYALEIGQKDGQAIVKKEVLKYRRGNGGRPWEFLNFSDGSGMAVSNEGLETIKDEKNWTENLRR